MQHVRIRGIVRGAGLPKLSVGIGAQRVIAVSSAAPGDDKTTTAVNLAGTLAQPGGRMVLLVDAAHRTQRPFLEEALDALDPGKVIGLVFNGADATPAGAYDYYYRRSAASSRPD